MHYISALCLLCVFAATLSRRVNYCGSKMCGNTDLHTFCQFPPGPSASCTGYIDAPLTKDEKSRLLARLNQRRNEAAHGHLRNMPSAGNMLKLRWIEELAEEAQLWADQCRPPSSPEEHDECRDLYSITVGQCVASVVGEAPGLRVESMVDMWYMQSLLYKGNVSSYVPPEYDRYFYGDFGQIMWASSYTVGCGRSRFMVADTMQQLEHTLDRMEHKMQRSRITAKVRRELGDIPEEPGGYSSTTDFTNFLTGEEREKTIDKPVLNMMLKYMPYMKQYEGQLLSNSVGCLYSSLVLVCLSFCVVS